MRFNLPPSDGAQCDSGGNGGENSKSASRTSPAPSSDDPKRGSLHSNDGPQHMSRVESERAKVFTTHVTTNPSASPEISGKQLDNQRTEAKCVPKESFKSHAEIYLSDKKASERIQLNKFRQKITLNKLFNADSGARSLTRELDRILAGDLELNCDARKNLFGEFYQILSRELKENSSETKDIGNYLPTKNLNDLNETCINKRSERSKQVETNVSGASCKKGLYESVKYQSNDCLESDRDKDISSIQENLLRDKQEVLSELKELGIIRGEYPNLIYSLRLLHQDPQDQLIWVLSDKVHLDTKRDFDNSLHQNPPFKPVANSELKNVRLRNKNTEPTSDLRRSPNFRSNSALDCFPSQGSSCSSPSRKSLPADFKLEDFQRDVSQTDSFRSSPTSWRITDWYRQYNSQQEAVPVPVTVSPGVRERIHPTGLYIQGTLSPTSSANGAHVAPSPPTQLLLRAARDGDDALLKEMLRRAVIVGLPENDVNSTDNSGRVSKI